MPYFAASRRMFFAIFILPFVKRKRYNRAAVLFYERKHGVHNLFFAAYGIYKRLAVVAPHSAFHCDRVGSIYLQRQVGYRLNFADYIFKNCGCVNFGKPDVYVQNVRAALRLTYRLA